MNSMGIPRLIDRLSRAKTARWVLLTFVAVTLTVALFYAAAFGIALWQGNLFGIKSQNEDEKRLLHRTDHATLSAACEQLWQKRETVQKFGDYNPKTKFFRIQSTHPALPIAIRALRQFPAQVEVDTSAIRIEMGGGFCHYGFVWDPESTFRVWRNQHNQPMTTKQVATNLWFYTEAPKLPEAK